MITVIRKALRYRRVHGTRKLFTEGVALLRARRAGALIHGVPGSAFDENGWVSARELVKARSQGTTPIRVFSVPAGQTPRVTVVTDSINRGSLYGGVGTALILAALIAEARGARLRVVTRTERALPGGLDSVLRVYGFPLTHEVEFTHAPCYDPNCEIDTLPDELYLTTSWWTTASVLPAVPADCVLYLLQEDERMFYPFGDEHLRCSQVLANRDIRFVVNTRLLFDHFVADGLPNVRDRGLYFEPAFPPEVFHPRPPTPGTRRTLMFYARPNNARNLFLFGLDLLETAITRGILDLSTWDVVFVGKDIPKIRLDDGRYTPKRLEHLSWSDYADLAGRVDLGLCLMYTPHPSYPPFDLAASGAVVVTNRYGRKQDLSPYSKNIITGDPEIPSMLRALAEGIRIVEHPEERAANHQANALGTDWRTALAGVVNAVGRQG
jgi:hypothetical protein